MVLLVMACSTPAPVHAEVTPFEPVREDVPEPRWPESGTPLRVLEAPPCEPPRETVFVMAGHANGRDRPGNTGVHGQIEADVNLALALDLAERLDATGCFDVVLGRKGDARPSYRSRIRHAERIGADAFIELHTDARGPMDPVAFTPHEWVYEACGGIGFSVLYNEGGPIGEARRALARSITWGLTEADLVPFPAYAGLYEADAVVGAHIDRRGLMMLRRPKVPSIIIETHNAKHFEESLRWREPETHAAFASGVAVGLTAFLEGSPTEVGPSSRDPLPRDPG